MISDHKLGNESMPQDNEKKADFGFIINHLLNAELLSWEQVKYASRVQSKIKTDKSLLEIVKELNYLTEGQIRKAIAGNIPSMRIGDWLVELGLITHHDLDLALQLQNKETTKRKLGDVLVAHNLIEEHKLISAVSLQFDIPFIQPDLQEIDPNLLERGTIAQYQAHNFIPVRLSGDNVLVAFADPMDSKDIDAAAETMGLPVIPAIATRMSILTAIERLRDDRKSSAHVEPETVESEADIVNRIIVDAIESEDVSGIHIDPMDDRLRVRFRLDGLLVIHKEYPLSIAQSLTNRIKVLCRAKTTGRQSHQVCRILFDHSGHKMDLKVSFYATLKGERIVMQFLNRQLDLIRIEKIGMSKQMLLRLREDALDQSSGIILLTGPADSGKTTTLYGCIEHFNTTDTSIITVEDPVEHVIEGTAQCSINNSTDPTLKDSLRHMMQQDPDITVIGEICDTYSAKTAVQAALTGHKVLTTFRAGDSASTLLQLINMGIDANLISSTVVCVVAQRLLRRICTHCARPYEITPLDLRRIGCEPNQLAGSSFLKGQGCSHCRYTGYRKRVAAFEVLLLNDSIRDLLNERKNSHQIRRLCMETAGLVTLFEDGLHKAALGITTVQEILRCLPKFHKPRSVRELVRLLGH
jgi:type IV pilus assembly protein PilB